MTPASPFSDPAADILRADPSLTDESRADLHDAFYNKNTDELVQHLHQQDLPEETKTRLWQSKQAMESPSDPASRIKAVGDTMKGLDPAILELMEAHPTVFKTLTAAMTPEKESESASGASKPAGKGKKPSKSEKPASAPPVPVPEPSWVKFKGKDGNHYEVHPDDLHHVQRIDPAAEVIG